MKLYWIRRKDMTNPLIEGYVGVTEREIAVRFEEHREGTDNPHLRRVFQKYELEIVMLKEGKKDDILLLENEMRPVNNVGWNIAPGGGIPPNAKYWWSEEHSLKTSERMKNNSFKKGVKESLETKQKKRDAYALNYESRSFAQKNKDAEWIKKSATNRKGKGVGENNAMSNPEAREKVAASKRGRKRVYREDGSFYMSKVN
jgi:hypothetical protein